MFFERRYRFSLRSVILFTGDTVLISLSAALAALVRLGWEESAYYLQVNAGPLTTSVGIYLLVFYIGGLYEKQALASKPQLFPRVLMCTVIGLILMIVIFYAQFDLLIGRGVLFLAALFTFFSAVGLRVMARGLAGYQFLVKNTLVVGDGPDAADIIRLVNEVGDHTHRLVGVVATGKRRTTHPVAGLPVVGNLAALRELVRDHRVETLVVATSMARETSVLQILRPLRYAGLEVLDYASFYERISQEIPLNHIDDEWLMHAAMNSSRIHIRKIKRFFDVCVAVVGLVVTVPICLLVTVLIKCDSRGPILFRQQRAGLDEAIYTLLKFRTMQADAEQKSGAVWAQPRDVRITRVGRFLRRSRLDEIPQLINVLRGEMSLVGPRPERPEFIEELTNAIPFYKERLLVPPGVTGWAQISYPYAASIDAARRKLQFDLFYIKHMSLFLDVLILLRTFKTILVGWAHSEEDGLSADEVTAVDQDQALTSATKSMVKTPNA